MKTLVTIVAIAILLIGLVLLGLSDTRISIADTTVPNNALASRISEASNSSARATITIMMYTLPNE